MKLNKTQQYILRYIFGFDDGHVSSTGTPYPLHVSDTSSRAYQFCEELVRTGLAVKSTEGWLVSYARANYVNDGKI
jgi:hypothetical protein